MSENETVESLPTYLQFRIGNSYHQDSNSVRHTENEKSKTLHLYLFSSTFLKEKYFLFRLYIFTSFRCVYCVRLLIRLYYYVCLKKINLFFFFRVFFNFCRIRVQSSQNRLYRLTDYKNFTYKILRIRPAAQGESFTATSSACTNFNLGSIFQ